MNQVQLLPFGSVPAELLAELRAGLSREFLLPCTVLTPEPEPHFALDLTRQQYHSTEILAHMLKRDVPEGTRLLGITLVDLYIPILTFVFGEAQLRNSAALVSTHRLRPQFYGMPNDPALLRGRLLKEAIHELGHTLGLQHCPDYLCVMSASHSVERIDLKQADFCPACTAAAGLE